MTFHCTAVGALVLACVMAFDARDILPPDLAPTLPKSVVISGARWADVRASQERYAHEFDLFVQRLDPALAQRGANYTEETDATLRKDIAAADFEANVPADVLEQRTAELLRQHPDPYERGQILFEEARTVALAGRGEQVTEAIEEALKLPLWPDQRAELYQIRGLLITNEFYEKKASVPSGEEPSFPEMRRKLATEYLRGAKVALDYALPRDLPDLQQPNTLERVAVPDDPVQRQAVMAAIEHRKMVEAKAMRFLGLLRRTETLRAEMEAKVVAYYAMEPYNTRELEELAADILQNPQEQVRLLEAVKARLDKSPLGR